MNKNKENFKKAINIYTKQGSTTKSLINVNVVKDKPSFKEHLILQGKSKVSLTSVEEVNYFTKKDGKSIRHKVLTNNLGKQNDGTDQYGLNYELMKDHRKFFLESEYKNIKLVRDFEILGRNEFIGFKFKTWLAIQCQPKWNTLIRGGNSYQIETQNEVDDSLLLLNSEIHKMTNSDTYDYIKENTDLGNLFLLHGEYYTHFRSINYYTREEWREYNIKQIISKREEVDEDNSDI